MTTQPTTPEPSNTSLPPMTLESLQVQIKKLRAARTKISQIIKNLEILLLDLNPESPDPAISSPEKPAKFQPKPKLSDHPAIQTYRDVFHTYPKKGVYQFIITAVGDKPEDLEIWRECCAYWLQSGWNPNNILGQIERYTEQRVAVVQAQVTTLEKIDGVQYLVYPDGSRELANFRKIDDDTTVTG